jgi:hypothetical protein
VSRDAPRERTPEFAEALALAHADENAPQPACHGRTWDFVDYQTTPDRAAARKLCAGTSPSDPRRCPLLDVCKPSALQERPDWGVQGGIAWVNGRQWHLRRTATHEEFEGEEAPETAESVSNRVEISAQSAIDPVA